MYCKHKHWAESIWNGNIDIRRQFRIIYQVLLSSFQDNFGPKIDTSSAINHVNTEPVFNKFYCECISVYLKSVRICKFRLFLFLVLLWWGVEICRVRRSYSNRGYFFVCERCATTRKVDQIYLSRLIFIILLIKYLEIIDNFFSIIPSNNWQRYCLNEL